MRLLSVTYQIARLNQNLLTTWMCRGKHKSCCQSWITIHFQVLQDIRGTNWLKHFSVIELVMQAWLELPWFNPTSLRYCITLHLLVLLFTTYFTCVCKPSIRCPYIQYLGLFPSGQSRRGVKLTIPVQLLGRAIDNFYMLQSYCNKLLSEVLLQHTVQSF